MKYSPIHGKMKTLDYGQACFKLLIYPGKTLMVQDSTTSLKATNEKPVSMVLTNNRVVRTHTDRQIQTHTDRQIQTHTDRQIQITNMFVALSQTVGDKKIKKIKFNQENNNSQAKKL